MLKLQEAGTNNNEQDLRESIKCPQYFLMLLSEISQNQHMTYRTALLRP